MGRVCFRVSVGLVAFVFHEKGLKLGHFGAFEGDLKT